MSKDKIIETYYHASPNLFDFPDYNLICDNRLNHLNGNLGLWVSKKSDWISNFGGYVYEISIEANTENLTVNQLQKWSQQDENNATFYQEKRANYLNREVEFISLQEANGAIEMGIVINFDCIKSFKLVQSPEQKVTPPKIK